MNDLAFRTPWRKSSYSAAADNCVECASALWATSSYSNGNGGECVQVADLPSSVAVRDSKHPAAGHLTLTGAEWSAFLMTLKQGALGT